jgi:hypothetical protein
VESCAASELAIVSESRNDWAMRIGVRIGDGWRMGRGERPP